MNMQRPQNQPRPAPMPAPAPVSAVVDAPVPEITPEPGPVPAEVLDNTPWRISSWSDEYLEYISGIDPRKPQAWKVAVRISPSVTAQLRFRTSAGATIKYPTVGTWHDHVTSQINTMIGNMQRNQIPELDLETTFWAQDTDAPGGSTAVVFHVDIRIL